MADGSRHSKDWIGAVWTVEVWQIRRGVVSPSESSWGGLGLGMADKERSGELC